MGGTASCILNAAGEIAVEAFLREEIGFTGIARTVRETLEQMPHSGQDSIAGVLEADAAARRKAREIIDKSPVLMAARG